MEQTLLFFLTFLLLSVSLSGCANQAPEIISVGPYAIQNSILDAFTLDSVTSPSFDIEVGETLRFETTAEDPDDDPITFSAGPLPRGAVFDSERAEFSWTPSTNDLGGDGFIETEVYIVAKDPYGAWDSVVVTIVASLSTDEEENSEE